MCAQVRITIRDVATTAGVSHQTVSRVINHRPDVADETRRRVWQVIESLNYQPSAIARSLIRRRSYTLGVVTAGLKFDGPSRTLNGITKRTEELGYTLLLKELPSLHTTDVQSLLNSLSERQVDGVLWAVPEIGCNRDWIDLWPGRHSIPVIFITMESRPDLPIVAIDNYAGGRMATEHLLAQGYRHIGHITGPLDWWEARQRQAGWRDALLAAGHEVAGLHAEEGNWSSASGEQAIGRLLAGYPDMDAVFVANDQMALSVLQVACREGIRVPHDLAVVGFDGLPESAHFWPPLTTIYQDLQFLGGTAVQELVRAIEASHDGRAPFQPEHFWLAPELIVRASSGPAAAPAPERGQPEAIL